MPVNAVYLAIPVLGFLWATWRLGSWIRTPVEDDEHPSGWTLLLVFALLLAIRLGLALSTDGYQPDVLTFKAWAAMAAADFTGFYSSGSFADYPPGYIYVLYLIGWLKGVLGLGDSSRAFLLLIKLPAIVADLAAAWLVYRLAAQMRGGRTAHVVLLLYGFNPAIIINSAVWGQVDAVFTLFIALCVVFLGASRLVEGIVTFAVALLIKPQALIFTPLVLCVLGEHLLQRDLRCSARAMVSLMAGALVFGAGILPFAWGNQPSWIVQHYLNTLSSYPYASLNAYNLYTLFGGNFAALGDAWLSLSYKTWGSVFVVLATMFALAVYGRAKDPAKVPFMAMFLMAAVFVLCAKMHERYLYPALIFSLLAFVYGGDRRMLALFAGFTATHFLNVCHVLMFSMQRVFHVPRLDPLLLGVSLLNVLLLLYTIQVGIRHYLVVERSERPARVYIDPSSESGGGA